MRGQEKETIQLDSLIKACVFKTKMSGTGKDTWERDDIATVANSQIKENIEQDLDTRSSLLSFLIFILPVKLAESEGFFPLPLPFQQSFSAPTVEGTCKFHREARCSSHGSR